MPRADESWVCHWTGPSPPPGESAHCAGCDRLVTLGSIGRCHLGRSPGREAREGGEPRERSNPGKSRTRHPVQKMDAIILEEIGGCRYLGPVVRAFACGCGGSSLAEVHTCGRPEIGECLISRAVRTTAARQGREKVDGLGCCESCPSREDSGHAR